MADVVTPEKRSQMMAGIRGKNTLPELLIRRGLHKLGFRFQLHRSDLPGKPDLVFPRRHAVLLIQGCFWHGHHCHLFKWPSTRPDFWKAKIEGNVVRDQRVVAALGAAGWRVGIVWECAVKGREKLPLEQIIEKCAKWLQSSAELFELKGRI